MNGISLLSRPGRRSAAASRSGCRYTNRTPSRACRSRSACSESPPNHWVWIRPVGPRLASSRSLAHPGACVRCQAGHHPRLGGCVQAAEPDLQLEFVGDAGALAVVGEVLLAQPTAPARTCLRLEHRAQRVNQVALARVVFTDHDRERMTEPDRRAQIPVVGCSQCADVHSQRPYSGKRSFAKASTTYGVRRRSQPNDHFASGLANRELLGALLHDPTWDEHPSQEDLVALDRIGDKRTAPPAAADERLVAMAFRMLPRLTEAVSQSRSVWLV